MTNKQIVTINNWSFITLSDGYTAPENAAFHLIGDVVGHPTIGDRANQLTSRVQDANGRLIMTRNTMYELGTPSPAFIEYCKDEGIDLDLDDPFKSIK